MAKKNTSASFDLAMACVAGLKDKKAENITVLNLQGLSGAICDYFVIASGTSDRHVEAVADSCEDHVRKSLGEKPFHVEGKLLSEWILLDYVNVVVHVFQQRVRDFYQIEKLWADGELVTIKD